MDARFESFLSWLIRQWSRGDQVGDIATYWRAATLDGRHLSAYSLSSMDRQIQAEGDRGIVDALLNARDVAWREFAGTKPS